MDKPTQAFHGGAFFGAIGESLRTLARASEVISADVLDAWYDPSPKVLAAVQEHLPFLIRTSPPTHGEGLREVIAEKRGVPVSQVLLGSGTSSLMFMALPRLIGPGDKVLVLDPSYGEYAHIVENVIGGELVRFELPLKSFEADLDGLVKASQGVALVVIVNPNSPTGRGLATTAIHPLVSQCPNTRFWIDETYIDFFSLEVGQIMSVEQLVTDSPNLIVGKSMSKFYGLSGLRVGYLVADSTLVKEWERFSPPWSVGLIGQLAAIEALLDTDYYATKARETRELRTKLVTGLESLGLSVVPSVTNFVMAKKPDGRVAELVGRLAENDVFIRDANNLSPRFEDHWLRIAVKDGATQSRLLDAISSSL